MHGHGNKLVEEPNNFWQKFVFSVVGDAWRARHFSFHPSHTISARAHFSDLRHFIYIWSLIWLSSPLPSIHKYWIARERGRHRGRRRDRVRKREKENEMERPKQRKRDIEPERREGVRERTKANKYSSSHQSYLNQSPFPLIFHSAVLIKQTFILFGIKLFVTCFAVTRTNPNIFFASRQAIVIALFL